MTTVAVDYDDTLVDARTQEWLPDAQIALKEMLACGVRVIVHSCRANHPTGRAAIEAKLAEAHLWPTVTVVGKPDADVYVDNLGYRHEDWASTRHELRVLGLVKA